VNFRPREKQQATHLPRPTPHPFCKKKKIRFYNKGEICQILITNLEVFLKYSILKTLGSVEITLKKGKVVPVS
jgi:hypothetical protein